MNHHRVVSYKDVLTELMSSFEGISFGDGSTKNLSWLDVPLNCEEQQKQFIVSPLASSFSCDDQQQHFILSPSITIQTPTSFKGKYSIASNKFFSNDNKVVSADANGTSCLAPDLGWVNKLMT
ncbi:putative zinc finger CCCH domain-containing protein 2-like [Sesbania bispinosa]|nr:putative zinc finger CCCH domain-containing protein 2-like [Sesbania bispinosa]